MVTALHLARAVREPGFQAPAPGSAGPPAFLTVPTTVARKAVRTYHQHGAAAADTYVAGSKLAQWAGHTHKSMASNAQNTIDGITWYMAASMADGRTVKDLDAETVCNLPSGPVAVRVDAVLPDGANALAGRVVLSPPQVPLIAAVYSQAMAQLYPSHAITRVAVWQARRNTRAEVSFAAAQAKLGQADQLRAGL